MKIRIGIDGETKELILQSENEAEFCQLDVLSHSNPKSKSGIDIERRWQDYSLVLFFKLQ
jgi:hypothetical protein